MKMKKVLAFLLVLVMVVGMLPGAALANETPANGTPAPAAEAGGTDEAKGDGAYDVNEDTQAPEAGGAKGATRGGGLRNTPDPYEGYTKLYLDKGAITIGDGKVSGYAADGTAVTTPSEVGYYITRTDLNTAITENYGITATGGTNSIVLDNLNVNNTANLTNFDPISITGGTQNVTMKNCQISAFDSEGVIVLSGRAVLNLTVQGTNTITNSNDASCIRVPSETEFQITEESTGVLNAVNTNNKRIGAVIGSTQKKVAGNITINGGTLNVVGETGSSAGIGSGQGKNGGCGAITINGGNVTVKVGDAAAIGDGYKNSALGAIKITGGTIYAQRTVAYQDDVSFPAIGIAISDTSQTIVSVTGGSIHTETFFNDELVTTKHIETLTSNCYLMMIQVKDASDTPMANAAVTNFTCSSAENYGVTDVQTDANGWLYLWLPAGDTTVNFTCGGEDYSFTGEVKDDNTTVFGAGEPEDPKETLKTAAIAAFATIPVYDGTNQAAIAEALSEARVTINTTLAAWSIVEARSWEGYQRYADALALADISYPTVTLTVMGRPESEAETAHYYIEPTNFFVPAGSTAASVVTQALADAGIACVYDGQTTAGGDFFIKRIGNQANKGMVGWMYMVNSNAYIDRGMNNYAIAGGENILMFYSVNGYGGAEFNTTNSGQTPYGSYASFDKLKTAANGKDTVDLKGSTAAAVMEQDWSLVSADIGAVRVNTDTIALTAVGPNGSSIAWTSDNSDVVANDGRVTLPDADTQVTLRATLSYGGQTAQKSLAVTVGKAEPGVTLTVSGAAATDNVTLGPTALTGLTGLEKYGGETPILQTYESGKNITAMDALVKGLGDSVMSMTVANPTTAEAAIGTLFNLGYDAATGRQWMLRVKDKTGATVYEGDHYANLLAYLADGDSVEYRYVAGTAALKILYQKVEKVTGSTYSAESYAAFDAARAAAKAILDDVFTPSQAEVDAAYTTLQSTYNGLIFTFDYFAGGEESAHQKVLNWLVENPQTYKDYNSWGKTEGYGPGLQVLSQNGLLTEEYLESLGSVSFDSYAGAIWQLAMTTLGYDLTYYHAADDFREYVRDLLMAGKAQDSDQTGGSEWRFAFMLIAQNGAVHYPDYQNRSGSDKVTVEVNGRTAASRESNSVGLTEAYLINTLLTRQHTDGGWTNNYDNALTGESHPKTTAYVLIALAPYYYEDIPVPTTVDLTALKAACDRGVAFLQTAAAKTKVFATGSWVGVMTDSQVCLNALMFYGVDPESIKNNSGDGMITYTLKTFLADDGAHFEVPGGGNSEAGKYTARFAEMMEYYKQYKTNGRASLCGKGIYQNQAAKIELEQAYFEARWGTLDFDPNQGSIYTKQSDYTEATVTPLLNAVDAAYNVLVRLDSTAAEIAAAKQAIEDATAGLVQNTPAGKVRDQIAALTDITPDKPMTAEVAAARTAYNALTDAQKAEVTNYADLVEAEHWSGIAVGYKNSGTAIGNYLKKIGDSYAALGSGTTDDWKVIDMAIAGRLDEMLPNEVAVQAFVTASIRRITPTTMTDYERVLLALTAIGLDGADLTKYSSFKDSLDNPVTSLVDEIANFDGVTVVNSMTWGLIALDSGDYAVPAGATWTRQALTAQLLAWQLDSGAWPINPNGAPDNDTTAMAIVALMPYMEQAAVKTAVEKAQAYLTAQQATSGNGGFVSSVSSGATNSNSTAMVLLARIAAGEDPKAAYGNGGNAVTALLSFGLANYSGFGYTDNQTANDMATEQSFRALAAYKALAYEHNTRPYYFGTPTNSAAWSAEAGVIAQIAAIGEVTLQSKAAIEAARAAYDALTAEQKALVTNYATLTAAEARLAELEAAGSGSGTNPGGNTPSDKTITVTFRLIGAEKAAQYVDLGTTEYLPDYVTWVPTVSYTLDKGATVYDLWTAATAGAGIRSVGAENDYVKTVYAPDDLGGYALSEFSNGRGSGWMYTVNGSHPSRGLKNWTLYDGDTVIWHYVNDYSYEVEDWAKFGGSEWPAAESSSYYSRWLKAPDTYGGKGGGLSKAAGDKKDENKTVTGAEGVTLTAEELQAAADAGQGVTVETENGTVKLDAATVKAQAKGGEDVAVEVKDNGDGTRTVGVSAGGKAVDADVKIELPAKDGQMLVVVGPDGTETPVILSATEDGTMYAKVPAGATVKVVDAEGKDFGDVKATDWFAEAVEFVSSHGIFQGTGEGFEPGTTMNRAMLATVLFRISGEAAPASGAEFGDVPTVAWFADAVSWASAAGIVNGRGEGFAPDAPVTREEIATMLYRFVQYLGVDVSGASADLSKFPDGGDTSPWAGEAMQWAVSVGLFRGGSGGALNPGGEATRAEVATLVERLVTLLVK